MGTFLDITERKRTEEALRRSEADLREAQRIAEVGSWTRDVASDTVTWSEEIYRIFSRDPKLPAPSVAESTKLFTPESWARSSAAQQETLERGTPYILDLEVVRPDGTRGWMTARGEAERDGSGQVTKLRGTTQDITERKNAEQALARRTQELERSNADLAQFAYVASHDLKEPLRAVSGCVGLLKRHDEGKLDERAGEYMTHIVDGSVRMESLIDGLLAFSRVGTQGRELRPVECAKALGTALQNLATTIQESGAVVTQDPLPAVNGDLPQLVSLFQNLIGNALKFRKEAPPRIHVSAERNGASWRFSVRDNGIGIAPQYFERIFGVFSGCTLAASIPARASAWRFARKSWSGTEAGSGWSPCRAREPPFTSAYWMPKQIINSTKGIFMPEAIMCRPIEILLVEDSPSDAFLTREAFNSSKLLNKLHVVDNGVDAIAFLRRESPYTEAPRPDIILLDLNLPKMDGREVLQEIKTDDDLKIIPVVVLTSSEAEEDVLKSYNLHANCYVSKPVEFDKFARAVRAIREFWFTVVTLPQQNHNGPLDGSGLRSRE